MGAVFSLLAVAVLCIAGAFGTTGGWGTAVTTVLPYLAFGVFLFGMMARVVIWARSPVPFRIPTVSGQASSLPWIRAQKLESPPDGKWAVGRMLLEILFFRSLFRNTKAEMRPGPKVVYGSSKWLWAFALAMHWALLVIVLRHLRFFTEPVLGFASVLDSADGFFRFTLPVFYATDAIVLVALIYLAIRRFTNPQVRMISQAGDYFPLFLLVAIAASGVAMRYLFRTDVVGIKEYTLSLLSFSPALPASVGGVFTMHLLLVCTLFFYFPFSKLVHFGGVFLTPTRNLANNNREVRHVNPWNPVVELHSFDHWAEEFKEEIAQAGYELKRD